MKYTSWWPLKYGNGSANHTISTSLYNTLYPSSKSCSRWRGLLDVKLKNPNKPRPRWVNKQCQIYNLTIDQVHHTNLNNNSYPLHCSTKHPSTLIWNSNKNKVTTGSWKGSKTRDEWPENQTCVLSGHRRARAGSRRHDRATSGWSCKGWRSPRRWQAPCPDASAWQC